MLAKPEYSSPPDEVCCWPGRCGGADGRECHGEEDCGTVAESHLEDAAGRGAAAKSYREDVAGRGAEAALMAGRGAVAELLAGAPWLSSWQGRCGRDTAARESHREDTTGQERRGRAAGRQLQEGITAQKKESDP